MKYFGTINLQHNLWNEFEYYELNENMRQKNDPTYADILTRVRIGIIYEKLYNIRYYVIDKF